MCKLWFQECLAALLLRCLARLHVWIALLSYRDYKKLCLSIWELTSIYSLSPMWGTNGATWKDCIRGSFDLKGTSHLEGSSIGKLRGTTWENQKISKTVHVLSSVFSDFSVGIGGLGDQVAGIPPYRHILFWDWVCGLGRIYYNHFQQMLIECAEYPYDRHSEYQEI